MDLKSLAERTPRSRDRYVDFLRAASILVVVFGHWFIALIWWEGGRIGVHNAIGVTKGMWLGTWLLQVMPVFFFVGGFSNAKTYESGLDRGEGPGSFLRARATRLLKPTAVFLLVWVIVQAILWQMGAGGDSFPRGGMLPFGPLWFLLVYLGVVVAVPLTFPMHKRWGWRVPLVDLLRFGPEVPKVGWLNLGLVWLLAHQLGYFYADGSLLSSERRTPWLMAIGGMAGLIVLTNIGQYPRSMLGTDVEVLSNMNPPTICIVALTFWLIGLTMLLRDRISRWVAKPRPWAAVIAANSMIMTLFLWHMTAYLIVIVVMYPRGLGHPRLSTAVWWIERPVWLILPALVLAGLLLVFSRFERPRIKSELEK